MSLSWPGMQTHPTVCPTTSSSQVFFISLFLAIFAYKKEQSWHWVAVGLLTDFCLRFYVSRWGCCVVDSSG